LHIANSEHFNQIAAGSALFARTQPDFAPRDGLVWPSPTVAAVKFLASVYEHRKVSAISARKRHRVNYLLIVRQQ
jgi:hypothetical protein